MSQVKQVPPESAVCENFILTTDAGWLTVSNVSICIRKRKKDVQLLIYPLHKEMDTPLDVISILYPNESL